MEEGKKGKEKREEGGEVMAENGQPWMEERRREGKKVEGRGKKGKRWKKRALLPLLKILGQFRNFWKIMDPIIR